MDVCALCSIAEIGGIGQETDLASSLASHYEVLNLTFVCVEDALEVGTDLSTRSMAVMAWHPDWQLLTKAALKLIKQPDFACQVQADLHGLVKLLQPNPCVQLTAAAIVCALQHSIMQQPQSRVGQKPHPNPVLEGADLDSVLAALCQGLMVSTKKSSQA